MISDPAQLLQRIPELEALAVEAKIRKAIEDGDPFKVYRALFWTKWFRKLPAQQSLLNSLLAQRRLFAKPLKGKPALGTFNTVGFGFVGNSEQDKDGVHIALHAFVVFLAMPLLPLGSYLVKSEGRKGLSSHWRIYARVPMGALGWLYSRGMATGLAGLLVFGMVNSYWASRNQDVTILNGFDKTLVVAIAGHRQSIPAQGKVVINVPAGKVAGTAALENGSVLDRLDTDVHSEAVYAVWNIAGAAPLYKERLVYRPQGTSDRQGSNSGEIYCGKQYLEFGSIDFAFETPPKTMQMNSHESSAERSHLDVGSMPGQSQQMMCLNYAASKDQLGLAADALAAEAAMRDWDVQATGLALVAASQNAPAKAVVLARRARDAKPMDVDLQRMYLHTLDLAGMADQARKEFDAKALREPNSPLAQYLDAALLDGDAGVARLTELTQRFSEPYILRSLVWREWANGHNENAVRDWARLQGVSAKDAAYVLDADVGAELALHQPRQALLAIASAFGATTAANAKLSLASDYALVAGGSGGDRESMFRQLDARQADPAMLAYFRVRSGLEPERGYADGILAELALALRDSPDKAMGLAAKLKRFEFQQLAREHWALLYAEAVRTDDQPLQDKLVIASQYDAHDRDQMKAFARGEIVKLDGVDIDPESGARREPERAAADPLRIRSLSCKRNQDRCDAAGD